MIKTHPRERIEFNRRQVERCWQDVEEWKQKNDPLRGGQRVIEDLVSVVNHSYIRIKDLDLDVQEQAFINEVDFPAEIYRDVRALFGRWLAVARLVEPEGGNHSIEGFEELKASIRESELITTPDSEFFSGEKLDVMAGQAIEEHHAGCSS